MKTFVKKNLIAVFALLLGIGTMSFKMVEKSNQTLHWFAVLGGQTIDDSEEVDPESCPPGESTTCAIAFSRPDNIPATLVEGREDDDYAGEAYKDPV